MGVKYQGSPTEHFNNESDRLKARVAELEGKLTASTTECARRGDTIARQLQQNEKLAAERYKLRARATELEKVVKMLDDRGRFCEPDEHFILRYNADFMLHLPELLRNARKALKEDK